MIPLFKVHKPKNIGSSINKVFDEGVIAEGKYTDNLDFLYRNNIS